MTTYRERRLARAERLREWAEKREKKADAAHERVREIADGIPFGQPILVGHHSERRARRDQARMESGMRASIENADKARSMSSRADSIEAQAEHAIYSDDPDAVERLEARIAELEAERERIKAYNASCRKGERDVELLDEKQQRELKSTAEVAPYQLGKNGAAPSYWLTNLGGNIRRNQKRLESIRRGDRPSERVIVARYGGECGSCGATIERGETILYRKGEPIRHAPACPEEAP